MVIEATRRPAGTLPRTRGSQIPSGVGGPLTRVWSDTISVLSQLIQKLNKSPGELSFQDCTQR